MTGLPRKPRATAGLVLLTCALGGCGQKGALYLPQTEGEVITRPTQTPANTAPEPSGTDESETRQRK